MSTETTTEESPYVRRRQEREQMLRAADVQPIEPEDVPADWVQVAEDHYSMPGLIRNILSGVAPVIQAAERTGMDRIRAFELEPYQNTDLLCPDCEKWVYLSSDDDETRTLGDLIDAVAAHECPPEVLAALNGEEVPAP